MPSHPLNNFEMPRHYEHVPKFKGVYSRNDLPYTTKDGV